MRGHSPRRGPPLAASAARQLDRRLDDDLASRAGAGARVTVDALAPPRGAAPDPVAPRLAHGSDGAVAKSMARQSGVADPAPAAGLAAGSGGAVLCAMARQTGVSMDTLRAAARGRGGAAPPAPAPGSPRVPDAPAPAADLDPARGFPPSQRSALSGMRRVIAERLSTSKRDAPHYYMSADCVADPLLAMRRDFNALLPEDERLSVNDLVLALTARCVARHPALNAAWAGDAIARFDHVNLAVAVSVEGGLVTPVLRGADRMSLRALAAEARRLADAARRRALPGDAFDGGTFTVSNLGMYPVSQFAAIVNPPQAAILAVAAAERRVIALDDERSAVRRIMTVTLSVDHRVADGVAGAQFLADFKALVEDPRRAVL